MKPGFFRRAGTIAALAVLLVACIQMRAQGDFGGLSLIRADSIPKSELIQPEELNHLLSAQGGEKPLVLQVGSLLMFREAHIQGAEYAGVASQAVGLQQLQKRVASFAHGTFIVLYCGCCPWNRCPNVGPAFKLLHDFGFTHLKVLYLANDFGTDWVDKGFPVERRH
jgi:thiosulfate/3-mercaptopyruvate sulfurtransferase